MNTEAAPTVAPQPEKEKGAPKPLTLYERQQRDGILSRATSLELPKNQPMRNPLHARWFARRVDEVMRQEIGLIERNMVANCEAIARASAKDLATLKGETVRTIEACAKAIADLNALIESRTLRGRWRRFVRWLRRDPGPEPLSSVLASFESKPGETPA